MISSGKWFSGGYLLATTKSYSVNQMTFAKLLQVAAVETSKRLDASVNVSPVGAGVGAAAGSRRIAEVKKLVIAFSIHPSLDLSQPFLDLKLELDKYNSLFQNLAGNTTESHSGGVTTLTTKTSSPAACDDETQLAEKLGLLNK